MSRLDNVTLVDQSDDGYTFELELTLGETPTRYTFALDPEGALLTETETLTHELPELHIPAGAVHSARNIGDATARWLYGYKSGN